MFNELIGEVWYRLHLKAESPKPTVLPLMAMRAWWLLTTENSFEESQP
jgi:hypothetical protein